MSTAFALAQMVGVFFVGVCILVLILDIVRTIFYQFKGDGYEWDSVKLLKKKRRWWEWVIVFAVFAVGVYACLPLSIIGEADFRAPRQKPEYTAYYRCEYDVAHYGKGTGYIEIRKEDGMLYAERIYTSDGVILMKYHLEEIPDNSFWITFCGIHDSNVKVGEETVQEAIATAAGDTVIFGWPDATKDYCIACRECGSGYYGTCDGSEWLCPGCTDTYGASCAYCEERCPKWKHKNSDFVICDYCLSEIFQSERKQWQILN